MFRPPWGEVEQCAYRSGLRVEAPFRTSFRADGVSGAWGADAVSGVQLISAAMEQTATATHAASSVHVRRADLKRNARLKLTFAIFRFCLYGMVGLSSEIFFYNLVRIARHVPLLEMLFRFQWRGGDRVGPHPHPGTPPPPGSRPRP